VLARASVRHAAWGVPGPLPFLENLTSEYGRFLERARGPYRSKVDVQNKNEAKTALEAALRTYIQGFVARNPYVTVEDRAEMDLPARDTVRTPHLTVSETVEYTLYLRGIREIMVRFHAKGSTHAARPARCVGAVVVWDVLDAPPERAENLTRHALASRTPHALEFAETERGKTVYTALAWQNERGITGAWSDIKSAVIP
jgi:hypothetical protein